MTESGDIFEQMRLYLPKYLTAERQDELRKELRAFPHNKTIYTAYDVQGELLQGDGWRGFLAIDFFSRQAKVVSGLILSNSCDIDTNNRRWLAPNVTFAPLVRLDAYIRRVSEAGATDEQIADAQKAIRRQEVTSLVYLPAIGGVMEESVARLDDVRGHPVEHFMALSERSRLFRLNDFGFYLFLFKLSLHFTRMQEGVLR